MRDLEDIVALVTGGSRGIGRALSVDLVDRGATVYTCARTEQGLAETEQLADGPGKLHTEIADVTELEDLEGLIGEVGDEEGQLDALVNNAGVLGPRMPLEEIAVAEWRHTLAANLDGVFLPTKASLALMRESEAPVILNVSSSVGRQGRANWGPYAVSKFGVEGFTEVLADELADDGACVVSVNPGGTATPMRAQAYPDEDPETLPSADRVAETMSLLIERLEPPQTGRKYNSRDLFEAIDAESSPAGDALPHWGEKE